MKKNKSDVLIQRLVNNKISSSEFQELLDGLEDVEGAINLEKSMRKYFDEIIEKYKHENQTESKINSGNDKSERY